MWSTHSRRIDPINRSAKPLCQGEAGAVGLLDEQALTGGFPQMNQANRENAFVEGAHFLVRCLRYRYRTEKLQIATMMRLNLRGATVLDIGANKGIYCFWLARAVGISGRVIAFEPQPEMAASIKRRKLQFKLNNLSILGVGLSDCEGHAMLGRQKIGDGSASFQNSRHRNGGEILTVPTIKLDTIERDLSNLKFIKCDVEGHELNVFLDAEQTIRRYRPIIQFEAIPDDARDVFDFFLSLGYSGVMMLGGRFLNYTSREAHYKFDAARHRDFLFFPPEAIGMTIPSRVYRQFPPDTRY
jgi:FkbM family methyltransferase